MKTKKNEDDTYVLATKKQTVTKKEPAALDSTAAREKLMAWLAETYAVVESIGNTAREIAAEVSREGSPFYGMVDAAELNLFGGRLCDLTCSLTNNWPDPPVRLLNPLALEA